MPDDFEGPEGPENLDQPPSFFPYDAEGRPIERVDFGELVEVDVRDVISMESNGNASRFVLLSDGERQLPIMIGPFESMSIAMARESRIPERPLTHDLLKNIILRLDSMLERVVIDDLWNATYYAKLYLRVKDGEVEIDARPSDAIAMAIRFNAPIFVADGILETAGED